MSLDISSFIVVGWILDAEQILKKLGRVVEEKSHMEPRFHEKTGKKLTPVKVVDKEAHRVVELDGQAFEVSCCDGDDSEIEALAEYIADKFGCHLVEFGDNRFNSQPQYAISLCRSDDITPRAMASALRKAPVVEKKIRGLGIQPSKFNIFSVYLTS
jgi:hypothetical protein